MLLIYYRNAIANVIKCNPINWIRSEYKKNNQTIQIYTHLFLITSMHLGIPHINNMKDKDDNEIKNRKKFSENFKSILAVKEITPYKFGKLFFPEKKKSTIGYYYLNNPNITIYNLCKVAIILKVDITIFFQDYLKDIIELEKVNVDNYYSLVLKNIANNIKSLRKEQDELLLDLEVLSNIDSSNLSKIENAKSNLSIGLLTRVANTLNTNIQELLK